MTSKIDYSKYEGMTKYQLAKAAERVEKSTQVLQERFNKQLKEKNELLNFLKSKLRESFADKNFNLIAYKDTKSYKKALAYEATLTPEQIAAIDKEIESDINRDYDDGF
ncbi:hypothetical protein [Campylobacter troglodytis]|uniref:hypothetical protein n=1 Tax=Campylobacter troglodytis TaxID=654363 RepID=UPI0011580D62|nr:hypothetical protein [Campylobacter troglodytis]TQR59649.1 hypothetical protein DMC01_06975 [Campylobacter troglodytis]